MALYQSPYCGHKDTAFAGSLPYPATPPTVKIYSTSSTPLMLPRDWSEGFDIPVPLTVDTSDPDNYDFQSNHLENARLPLGIIPSLAGLGIRNFDLVNETDAEVSNAALYTAGNVAQDPRRLQRAQRTDSVYDVLSGTHNLSIYQQPSFGLGSPWTFSSILRATEFYSSHHTSEASQVSLTPGLSLSEPSSLSTQADALEKVEEGEDDIAWCFEKLSAATGLSVADFAAELSASAEATLKRMGAGNDLDISSSSLAFSDPSDSSFSHGFNDSDKPLIWPPLPTEMSLSLPFVDINLRALDLSWNTDGTGVDPADILPNSPSLLCQLPHMGESGSSGFSNNQLSLPPLINPVRAEAIDMHVSKEDSYLIGKEEVSSPGEEPYTLPLLKTTSRCRSRATKPPSDDDAFQSPSSSEYSPFLQPLDLKRNHFSRINTRRVAQQVDAGVSAIDYSNDENLQHLPPINLGTPVFDAHRGIELEELKAKAERYRLRNQGREYDKRWLISFAGKLSERGELVEEFRCYVSGCKQTNKRRDHILIHVGAHLDQRPFKCMHCSARFLRKNECKRHELSHTGVRPFSCHLCPGPATTFVRQDLLKRHMKRTHRFELKIDKENEEPLRPKKRAKF